MNPYDPPVETLPDTAEKPGQGEERDPIFVALLIAASIFLLMFVISFYWVFALFFVMACVSALLAKSQT